MKSLALGITWSAFLLLLLALGDKGHVDLMRIEDTKGMDWERIPLETTICGRNLDLNYIFDPTPIFHWCVLRWGSKSKHHKGICLEEIGLCL